MTCTADGPQEFCSGGAVMGRTIADSWRAYCQAVGPVTFDHYLLAADDASLGVGHSWTNTQCPAYNSLDPDDCQCGAS